MVGRCKHNYVFTQGYFYCTKCGKRRYGSSYKKRQGKKIGIGISIALVVGIVGFFVLNGVLVIDENRLNESMQKIPDQIQKTTATAQKLIIDTTETVVPDTAKDIMIDTSSKIQEKSSEVIKRLEEERIKYVKEQEHAHQQYLQNIALKVHELVNEERLSRGLSTLVWNPTIAKASTNHSIDMANREYFAHDSPEGYDFTWRYLQVGYDCSIVRGNLIYGGGENIMYLEGYSGEDRIAQETVDGWMNSKGHRENILTPYFQSEGIGVAESGNKIYVTQNFC